MKVFPMGSRRAALVLLAAVTAGAAGLTLARGGQHGAGLAGVDSNGDRALSRAEIEGAASARFVAIDADHDGQVTLVEIQAYRERQRSERQAARLARLDTNQDGRIDQAEFVAARAERLLRLDRNGDGVLDASDRRWRHGRG